MKLKDWLIVGLVLGLGLSFAAAAIWQIDKLEQKIEELSCERT